MTRRIGMPGLACVAVTLFALGCSPERVVEWHPHAGLENLSETPEEHYQRVVRIETERRRALVEDLDLLFMTDRPTRLTRWHNK